MKIFHTADIHLNSNLKSNLDDKKAKIRREEIKNNFYALIDKAKEENADFFIIAGDLFDSETGITRLKRQLLDIIESLPSIKFLYLNGNHDENSFFNEEDLPANFYHFNRDWTYFNFGNITFAGKNTPIQVDAGYYDGLHLDDSQINIVVLHGDIVPSNPDGVDYAITLNELKNKHIDYLALGHKHEFLQGKLDRRCTFAYPGALDGRGFDELGEKGYITLDDSLVPTFHTFNSRQYAEVYVDISVCESEQEIVQKINQSINKINKENLVKVVLIGDVDISLRKDANYILNNISQNHFFVKIEDKTKIKINLEELMSDISIKGEYLRLINDSDEITPNIKDEVMLIGIKALEGEEF